jgi:hypothetical protein
MVNCWTIPTVPTRPGKVQMAESRPNSTSGPSTMGKATNFSTQRLVSATSSNPRHPNRPSLGVTASGAQSLARTPLSLAQAANGPRLRIWCHCGGPINRIPASGTTLQPNLSSACSTGGNLLGSFPRHRDMVTSSNITSGSTALRVQLKLALAARQFLEATSSDAPSPPFNNQLAGQGPSNRTNHHQYVLPALSHARLYNLERCAPLMTKNQSQKNL